MSIYYLSEFKNRTQFELFKFRSLPYQIQPSPWHWHYGLNPNGLQNGVIISHCYKRFNRYISYSMINGIHMANGQFCTNIREVQSHTYLQILFL